MYLPRNCSNNSQLSVTKHTYLKTQQARKSCSFRLIRLEFVSPINSTKIIIDRTSIEGFITHITLVLFPFFLSRYSGSGRLIHRKLCSSGRHSTPLRRQLLPRTFSVSSFAHSPRGTSKVRCSCNRINGSPLPPRCVLTDDSKRPRKTEEFRRTEEPRAKWRRSQLHTSGAAHSNAFNRKSANFSSPTIGQISFDSWQLRIVRIIATRDVY